MPCPCQQQLPQATPHESQACPGELQELQAYEQKTLPKREDPFKGFSQHDKKELHRLAQQLRMRMEDLPHPEPKGDLNESNT